MAQLTWTREAELWLKDIFDYISEENPIAATKVVGGIFDRAQVLTQYPEIGYAYENTQGLNIRILLYGHYRIAYLIKESGDIDVLGVFHGAMEIHRYLF